MNEDLSKTAPEIRIRPAEKSDLPAMGALFRRVFGYDRSQVAWQWKYHENPHGESLVYLALTDTDVVGLYGLIPRYAMVRGDRLKSLQEVDLMIHPDHTRGGLFKKLGLAIYQEAQRQGYDFTFGFPNQTSLPAGRRILKWRAIEDVPLFTRVLDPRPVMARKWPGVPGAITSATATGWSLYHKLRYRSSRLTDQSETTGEIPESLWTDHVKHDDIWFVRDPEYLAWRYSACPEMDYRVFSAGDGKTIYGFAVMGLNPGADAHLAELWCRPGDGNTACALVNDAADAAREHGCAVLRAWALKGSSRASLLTGAGFISRDSRIFHTIRSFRSPEFNRLLWDPRRWIISSGDSDCV